MVVLTGGVDTLDRSVRVAMVGVRGTDATTAARIITSLGSFPLVVTAAVITSAVLWWRTRQFLLPLVMLVSVAGTAATVYLLKIAISRSRPNLETLVGTPSVDYSFPSGHTTNGTLVYLLAALLLSAPLARTGRRALLIAAACVALLIGLSRIYLGYHWATDVLGGWLLAVSVVCAAAVVARRLDPSLRSTQPPTSA